MKVLLIGFGSIGKRHYDVLSKLSEIHSIDVVTKQNIENKICYKNLEIVNNINQYDYFVIASETNKHFEQLKFLEGNVKNKLIFCEKPLFESKQNLVINDNKVFIGYVLRFHPLLAKLKEITKEENIILANAKCGQYLPYWRPNTDYKNCYSAKKDEGGGVLLDLSHEIDYIQWICGRIKNLNSIQTKISDLEIDSDDLMILIGKTEKKVVVNISIDYISKLTHRKLLIETFDHTYELDFIFNKLVQKNKLGVEKVYTLLSLDRDSMFKEMHLEIFKKQEKICSYNEALEVMDTISMIQEQNR